MASRRRVVVGFGLSAMCLLLLACSSSNKAAPQANATGVPAVVKGTEAPTAAASGCTPSDQSNVFQLKSIDRKDFPVSGLITPDLSAYDDAMWTYMQSHNVTAGTLTVSRGGQVVLSRGYGWLDENRTKPVPPDALFRGPGLTKMITAAAAKQLVQKGAIAATAPLWPLLQVTPIAGTTPEPELSKVSVKDALDKISNPLEGTTEGADLILCRQIDVMRALGLNRPLTKDDIARYAADQAFTKNFALEGLQGSAGLSYLFWGIAIEKATGQSYFDYVAKNVLAPLGISDIKPAKTLPAQRDAREPWYADSHTCANVMSPSPATVSCPDGGLSIEALDSTNGLLTSGPAFARFMESYGLYGDPCSHNCGTFWYIGLIPGSTAVARWYPGDVTIVVLLNRQVPAKDVVSDPKATLVTALDNVTNQLGLSKVP